MAAPFVAGARPNSAWYFAGLTSSFPEIPPPDGRSPSDPPLCAAPASLPAACKVLQVPRADDGSQAAEVDLAECIAGRDLKDQVLVFRYGGKVHAIDHQCPHSSYPLSNGTPFDIEDFGVVLSAGITCPKHGWSFDLHTGQGDRGSYMLAVWEVQLRPLSEPPSQVSGEEQDQEVKEVWVRRKQRMG